jgi:hypothetical protein
VTPLLNTLKAAALGGGLLLLGSPAVAFQLKEPPRCDGSPARVGENMPFDTVDAGHAIEHVSSVSDDGRIVGWLFSDHDGSTWALTASDPSIGDDELAWMQHTFGEDVAASSWHRGVASRMVHSLDVAGLSRRRVVIQGCS